MRGVELHIAGASNLLGQEFAVSRRRARIVSAGDNQSRRADCADAFAEVCFAQSFATSDEALGAGAFHHMLDALHCLRLAFPETRGEPALHRRGCDRFRAALAHSIYSRVPRIRISNLSCCCAPRALILVFPTRGTRE